MTAQHVFWTHYLGLRTPDGPPDRERAARADARRRHVVDLVRRPAPTSRRRSRRTSRCACAASTPATKALALHPARGRHPEGPAVHEVLPRAARPVAVAADGADPARARPAPAVGAVLDLQLRLLGAADVRRARTRAVASARASDRRRPARDRRAAGQDARAAPAERAPPQGAAHAPSSGSATRQEADGSWGGIQPPWVWGIIALKALGHDDRGRDAAQRGARLGRLHGRGRRPPAPRGVPVADVGHGARRARAARVRRARRPSAARGGGRVPARRR